LTIHLDYRQPLKSSPTLWFQGCSTEVSSEQRRHWNRQETCITWATSCEL